MENQKRVLTFSEFTKTYANGDRFSAPGNDEQSVQKIKMEADQMTISPTIAGSKGEMDSVSSKPATKKIKTDYELSPPEPNGPVKMKDVKQEDKAETEKEPVKNLKKTKEKTKKSKEDEREESGEY